MPPKTWKKTELEYARRLGGERRGAFVSDGFGGKTDIILDGYAIEVKLSKKPNFGLMVNALKQAENNGDEGDIPLAIIKKVGDRYDDGLVVMRFVEFEKLFSHMGEKG
jgi:hypothetical protein